ncbi:MAG: prolipoprotein diacylglyceryl transferase [Mollicutes bacterium]|jgi:phosphatidylglycerol:prolipoprotein diacylglycerol transferase|nr:prolipoprotein diacylglyceryl transferase [Mollicutes bacterium]
MNPVFFRLGSFEIRWYSLLLIVGIVLSFFIVSKEAKKFGMNNDFVFNMLFWTIIFGFLGARLYYVVFNFHLYRNNLSDIFKVWQGGLAIHGGILFGIATLFLYCKRYKVNTLRILDISAVPLILAQAIGRWGNFFNSEAYGSATTLKHLQSLPIPKFVIDGMNIGGIYYTPTFFYESVWCIVGFLILLVVRRFRHIKIGQVTAIYLMWYSFGRFFIEISRTDSLMFFGYKTAQITSVFLFVAGLILFIYKAKKSKFADLYNDETNIQKIKY